MGCRRRVRVRTGIKSSLGEEGNVSRSKKKEAQQKRVTEGGGVNGLTSHPQDFSLTLETGRGGGGRVSDWELERGQGVGSSRTSRVGQGLGLGSGTLVFEPDQYNPILEKRELETPKQRPLGIGNLYFPVVRKERPRWASAGVHP